MIADGVDPELDDLRRIALHGKDYLARIQQRESEATGIPSLKISYNNVFGYYIVSLTSPAIPKAPIIPYMIIGTSSIFANTIPYSSPLRSPFFIGTQAKIPPR